jgi:hypothetical protein
MKLAMGLPRTELGLLASKGQRNRVDCDHVGKWMRVTGEAWVANPSAVEGPAAHCGRQ